MKIKSLSNQQIYVLIELWDQEKEQGKVVNISPSEIIKGYYQYSRIKQSHRVIISRGLRGLVNRGWLRKEGHRYSLTKEGRSAASEIIGLDPKEDEVGTESICRAEENQKDKAPQHDLKKLKEICLKARKALQQEKEKIEDKKEEETPRWKIIL